MSDEVKTIDVQEEEEIVTTPEMEELKIMADAGLLFGRRRSSTNPKMKPYIFTVRNGFEVFDLEKTKEKLDEAIKVMTAVVRKGQKILFVATRPAGIAPVRELAVEFGYPYVDERWLGGTLTNFETISERIKYYVNLKSDQSSGRLEKYTKKERFAMQKDIDRMNRLFGGLEKLTTIPALLVVVGAESDETALKEAKRINIPSIAIANTTANPDLITHIIPANDNGVESIQYIVGVFRKALKEAKTQPVAEEKKVVTE